ncbi:PTS beta-glucoside transporter subunit IIABC [Lactobacillus sp.] [Lactiplantibacillus mudanjiangensis]|uniref:beta-glucoside-specific PTS transporter subunit IIABC n=1 Tax=Lactiplantibacillus mudanjiangensis TaxID=1296538 RepID=UPI0010152B59|nr:beta-glucoside-specific PTS transporter subunit IIABC [Lactiplantibacillus mudanjiangensis]VDG21181.1 PTS beta-glucoside transporter subunit IIABC [Lactobacillus sp.] [Lactiplantibacillus mudanjiangensis]VDG31784.1 PTS beta-glucoside transporter subunit IIABC [Lactobacillus sp.] [Lactiplantibacillus mudanjiangensis]
MDYQDLAQQILDKIGGKENIQKAWHCATRLRFNLKAVDQADTEGIENLDGVITVVQSAGQYQVVIGNSVAKVYAALADLAGIANADSATEEKDEDGPKQNIVNRFIAFISGIFTPFLGALAGAGILKGLLALFVALNWMTTTSGAYKIWYSAGDAIFYFLPIFLAFTASKQLHVNQFVGVSLGAALLYPTLVTVMSNSTTLRFFGIPVMPTTYTSTVIPILLAIWVLSYLEPWFDKLFPESMRNIFSPLLSLIVMTPLTLLVVGPVGGVISNALANGMMAIYNFMPLGAGLIMGAFWQVFVIFGVHWTFVPLMMNNIAKMGYDPLLPILSAAVLSQAGAALGVFLKSKDTKMKALAGSSVITAFFGITEPTIYGVTLKLKRPFYCAVAAGAVGGGIAGFFQVHASSFTLPSLLALPTYLGQGFIGEVIGLLVAFIAAAVLTYFLGVKEDPSVDETSTSKLDDDTIMAPVEGTIIPLKNVNDEVFASEAMGQGLAIVPSKGEIHAPVDGTVTAVYPTGHAIGITSTNGAEILIHIGINTVQLDGQYFETMVEQNATVKCGDLLTTFDVAKIKAAGYDTTVMVIVTNTNDYQAVQPTTATEANKNMILTLEPQSTTNEGVPANV